MVRAIAFTESRSARIIGITGIRGGVGTSLVAREFAQAYRDFNKRILLVRACQANLSDSVAATVENVPDIIALSTTESRNFHEIDLANPKLTLPPSTEFFRYTLEAALDSFHAIIVDLPTALGAAGRPAPAFLALSPVCNLVLIVCLTGRTARAEIEQCLATCKLSGANVAGIILNDFQLPGSHLLADM